MQNKISSKIIIKILILTLISTFLSSTNCQTTNPVPPIYPGNSHAIQISICHFVSIFCPPGFNNNTIASQTYTNYPDRSSAQDTNNLNSPSDYNIDQTFISQNGSFLITKFFWVSPGASEVQCFQTKVPGFLPSPYMLQNATFLGETKFGLYEVYEWKTIASNPAASLFYYTTINTNLIVGFATNDKSQTGYFIDLKEVNNNEKAFIEPPVECNPINLKDLSTEQIYHVQSAFIRQLIPIIITDFL